MIAAVVLVVPLALYLLQDSLIFFPRPLSERARAEIVRQHAYAREMVLRSEDGKQLHAWHVPAAAGAPLVLYFGGNAEDVSWMIPQARRRTPDVAWLLVNYRGYGGSEGSPSEDSITRDALQWYDHAAATLQPAKVAVFGRSLGSGAAVVVASQRKVDAVVLVTPFDSLVEVAKRHYPFVPVSMMLRHPFDSIGRAPKIAAPLLCIAAQRDEIIPSSHARKLYDAWGGEKRWLELEGAGHNSTDGVPAFWQSIEAFLKK
ncbi:MAG: alpha/beta hydrolase [Betaproteobacteria bacterium]